MKSILLENGIRVRTFSPPVGFDPLRATAQERVRYGFPPMPEDPNLREIYFQVFNGVRDKFHYIVPTFQILRDRRYGPNRRRPLDLPPENSLNWSGAVLDMPYGGFGNSLRAAWGSWVVPNVQPRGDGTWYMASWIGIDGTEESFDIFQAGVECPVTQNGTEITRETFAIWEWYSNGNPFVRINNFPVSPGDKVLLILCSNGKGSRSAFFCFLNLTTGVGTSVSATAPGITLTGNCAEWIVEDPSSGFDYSQFPLADYNQVMFNGCTALTDTEMICNFATGSGWNVDMVDANGNVISSGEMIKPSSVKCVFIP